MLKKRIVSSILLIGIIAFAIYIDWRYGFWLCDLLIILLIIGGLYEFFVMVEKKGVNIYKYFGIGIGSIIPLSITFRFELTRNWELFFMVLALLFLILMQFRRQENSGVIVDIATTLFGILYVSWFFSFLIKIKYLPGGTGLLSTVLLITKLGDIGAYVVGSSLGKTPLMPRISPKKSVEGAIGGFAFSVLAAIILCRGFLHFNYLHLAFIGIFLGILGQLGDLSESLMKRDCQVKDSGILFPGIGGVLDSIDSLLFSAPVFYLYMSSILK